MKNIWFFLFRGSFFLWILSMSTIPLFLFAQEDVESKIGGISEKEFKRLYLLVMEREEKVSIDYWIEKRRLEHTLGENPERLQKALKELSVQLKSRTDKFLKDRGTTWEEFHRNELLFTKKNLDILFARHPDVLKRRFEVGKIKDSRMEIQGKTDVSQKGNAVQLETTYSSSKVEQYLMLSIESGELFIRHHYEKAKLEKEYGLGSLQIRQAEEKWAQEAKKIYDKWKISPEEHLENSKKYVQDQKTIDAYLADKPKLKERRKKLQEASDRASESLEETLPQRVKDRRKFLRTHPELLRRNREVEEKIPMGFGEKREKFLEENPNIKKEYEAIEQEIQRGIEALKPKQTIDQNKKETTEPPDIPHENVRIKIGGMPEEEFKRLYLLDMEMEEKIDIDYLIAKRRIEREMEGEDIDKIRTATYEMSKKFRPKREKFLKDRGTSWEEFRSMDSILFAEENLKLLFKRHPDVLRRRDEVNKIAEDRLAIEEKS